MYEKKYIKYNLKNINTKFLPKNIYKWSNDNYQYFYNITINEYTQLSIAIIDKSEILFLNKEIQEFIKIIKGFQLFFKENYNNHIIFLPTSFKKLWNKTDTISPININSGLTISKYDQINNIKNSTIIIFRKEECFKVLIHELLHVYILKCQNKLYYPLIEESIIETWATILNCHRLLSNDFYIINQFKIFNKIFINQIFIDERNFSLKQAYQLLINNADLQHTSSTYYYYIVKSAMLCNPIKFIKKFSWNEVINKCFQFHISDFMNNNIFINKIINIHKTNNVNSKNNENSENISLRMSKYGDYFSKKKYSTKTKKKRSNYIIKTKNKKLKE